MHLKYYIEKWQGDRPYMEDVISIQEFVHSGTDVPSNVFAIFDGHGGVSAADYASEQLLDQMHKEALWWKLEDAELITSIQNSFISTHQSMNLIRGTWPQTIEARPSNSGTTASIVSIHSNKVVISHVGDSTVVVAKKKQIERKLATVYITNDHKPNLEEEMSRIEACGGSVAVKKGVHRVVWTRKLKQSAENIHIPFLALSRSLGDLWSYNEDHGDFIVSPKPDVKILNMEEGDEGYIVVASDGLWNMLTPATVVSLLERAESFINKCVSPASMLMEIACARWSARNLRADNISIIIIKFSIPILTTIPATDVLVITATTTTTMLQLSGTAELRCDGGAEVSQMCAMEEEEEDGDENRCPKFYLDSAGFGEGRGGTASEIIGDVQMGEDMNGGENLSKNKIKRFSLDSQQPKFSSTATIRRSLLLNENLKPATPNYLRRTSFRPNARTFRVPTTPEERARYWRRRYRLAP